MQERWTPRVQPPPNLVVPVRIDPSGRSGPTSGQARGPRWRRTGPGLYVPSEVDPTLVEQRVLEQSRRLPVTGAVTGWASLRLAGAGFFDGLDRDGRTLLPVPLAVGAGQIRGSADVAVSRERLDPGEVVTRQTIACTGVRRALFDEMRRTGDVRGATAAMDMAAAAELASIRQMREYVGERPDRPGVRQVRAALDLADEHSRSPMETKMRLIWGLDAGLPTPLCNKAIFDLHGRHLGTVDLLDPVAGVVGEYDGAEHGSAARRSRDAERTDVFRRVGLEQFTVVGRDIHRTALVVDRMQSTRQRALASTEPARWTLQPPPDWEPELSLDDRFELRRLWAELAEQNAVTRPSM